jgi:hypothetical protein
MLAVLILLPIDWFSPTGQLFREAGAKPLNLFIMLCYLTFILTSGKFFVKNLQSRVNVSGYLLTILILGTFAFFINCLTFYYSSSNRTPEFQFFSQFSMFLMFIFIYQGFTLIFSKSTYRECVIQIIPTAVLIHLTFVFLEFHGIFSIGNPGILSLFRSNAGLIDRPSGLMSEPSYFGTFAGMYAIPLIFINKSNRIINGLMALALILVSIEIQAKTFIIVFASQLIYLVLGFKKTKIVKILITICIVIFIGIALYVLLQTQALNFEQNLSSVMRFGSNMLTLNVATSGYGLMGIGFGQFHFFYTPEFSPNFLLLSKEALDQMSNVNDSRASTFSLPLRILVETGVAGLFIAVLLAYRIFSRFHSSEDPVTQVGLLFLSGSLAFLFTQDSYCLPSLAFSLALVVTQKNSTFKK